MSTDARTVADRVERLLAEFDGVADPAVRERAEELVYTLMSFYGNGLARIAELIGPPTLARVADDELVGGLLVLHGLHPRGLDERVIAALETVRPYLGSHAGDVEYLGVDDNGVAHLRLTGSCDGCPSSAVTAAQSIDGAVRAAAPEVVEVRVQGLVDSGPGGRPLLPIIDCPVPEPDGLAYAARTGVQEDRGGAR